MCGTPPPFERDHVQGRGDSGNHQRCFGRAYNARVDRHHAEVRWTPSSWKQKRRWEQWGSRPVEGWRSFQIHCTYKEGVKGGQETKERSSNRKDNKTIAGDKGKHQGSNKDKSKGKDKDKDKDKDKGTSGDKAKGKDKSTQETKTDDMSSKDDDGNNTTSALVVGGDPPLGRNVAPLQLGPALPPRMVATERAA